MNKKTKGILFVALGLAMFVPTIFNLGYRTVAAVQWDRHVSGHIKRAADANSTGLAREELETVVGYLDSHNIKFGTTSVLWDTPDTDISFWYSNLKVSLELLKFLPEETGQAVKEMVLLKLRQTLLDHSENHEVPTEPPGISIYPYNRLMFGVGLVSVLLLFPGLSFIVLGVHKILTL